MSQAEKPVINYFTDVKKKKKKDIAFDVSGWHCKAGNMRHLLVET